MIVVRETPDMHGLGEALERLIVEIRRCARHEDGLIPAPSFYGVSALAKAIVSAAGRKMWNEETVFVPLEITVKGDMDDDVKRILGVL